MTTEHNLSPVAAYLRDMERMAQVELENAELVKENLYLKEQLEKLDERYDKLADSF